MVQNGKFHASGGSSQCQRVQSGREEEERGVEEGREVVLNSDLDASERRSESVKVEESEERIYEFG